MAKIVSIYTQKPNFFPVDMSHIRWLKIAETLASLGHQVDIATMENIPLESPIQMAPNLRRISLSNVQLSDYDVVKTVFHHGFETLEAMGGTGHPFIISKLGSVVGPEDREGIYFYGQTRANLFAIQERIQKTSRYITLLSTPAIDMWRQLFESNGNLLLVPGAADAKIPEYGGDPFPEKNGIRCLFAGNVYTLDRQPDANQVLVSKLNELGRILKTYCIQLYMMGPGNISRLNQELVQYLGAVPFQKTWDYYRAADVGIVLSAGSFQHNNESSKIYHYLRAGLPVVSESGFPNDFLIHDSKLGFSVESGNLKLMAERIAEAARTNWDRDFAIQYILKHHTWESRVKVYDQLFSKESPLD
jgi:glycosyltransferase involved in cell wall biosynthesis